MTHVVTRPPSPESERLDSPDHTDRLSTAEGVRLLLPLHDRLRDGLRAQLDELRLCGVSQARVATLAGDAMELRGLPRGITPSVLAMLATGARPLTLERVAQIEASGVIDVDDWLAAGDGLPSRAELAMLLRVLLATLPLALGPDGLARLRDECHSLDLALAQVEAQIEGVQALVARSLALEGRIHDAVPERRRALAAELGDGEVSP